MAPLSHKEGLSPCFQTMLDWVNHSIEKTMERYTPPDSWKLMMGCVAYGEKYTNLFLSHCIPSLFSEHLKNDIKLVIHTDKASVPKLREALKGVPDVEIHVITQAIIDDPTNSKYWLLGAVHNIQMQMARILGYSYHMLMPDHIYSRNYFASLRRLAKNHDAIAQGALSANLDKVDLSDKDAAALNGAALDNLHGLYQPYIMNGRDYQTDCPIQSMMIFIGECEVHILCPHMSPVYMSHKLLEGCPLRLFNTIDTQLPFFVPESVSVAFPSAEDDMAYIEVSDGEKNNYNTLTGDMVDFAIRFWQLTHCELGFLRYLNKETILALPANYKHKIKPMTNEEIDSAKSTVRNYVRQMYENIKEALAPEYRQDPLPQRNHG
jgi:hypothetical protein